MTPRFLAKVEMLACDPGCWIWLGALNRAGYGKVRVNKRLFAAHRYAYESAVGPIPDGLELLHRCDVPSCVRPDHLVPGTRQQNCDDMVSKDRQAAGERHPNARLRAAQVKELRELHASGGVSQRELATRYGVSQQLVSLIVAGKRWSPVVEVVDESLVPRQYLAVDMVRLRGAVKSGLREIPGCSVTQRPVVATRTR